MNSLQIVWLEASECSKHSSLHHACEIMSCEKGAEFNEGLTANVERHPTSGADCNAEVESSSVGEMPVCRALANKITTALRRILHGDGFEGSPDDPMSWSMHAEGTFAISFAPGSVCGLEVNHWSPTIAREGDEVAHTLSDATPLLCSIPVQEYEALHDLYIATDGAHWAWRPPSEGAVWNFTSVGSTVDSLAAPCGDSWQGITCAYVGGGNGTIMELVLPAYNMRGTIPSSVGSLEELVNLGLEMNSLTGSIPSSIGQLRALEYLRFGTNSLTGSIPQSIGQLTAMLDMYFNVNSLTGSIPSSIEQLTALGVLYLDSNSLTRSIPQNMGQLKALENLALDYNLLTGSIPSSIGQLTALAKLYLNANSLTGSIPPSIGQLRALAEMTLEINLLTGSIPSSIGQLTALVYLYLYLNSLTGFMPSSIGQLTVLNYLDLDYNLLTGSIPSSIGQLTALEGLYLDFNTLTGSIPSSIGHLTALQYVFLQSNSFSGSIAPSIGRLKALENLYLDTNLLSGSPHGYLQLLTKLVFLTLNANMLDGSLGTWISSPQAFPLLYLLDLAQNAFTGAVPAVLFELRTLRILSASENCFSSLEAVSPVPGCAKKSNLQTVQLNGLSSGSSCIAPYFGATSLLPHPGYRPKAFLSQPIPTGLWSLLNLTSLYLEGNGFTGRIDVGNFSVALSVLVNVSLANNRLTGPIPMALQQYGKFTTLDLSFNMLSGRVSESFTVSSAPGSTLALAVNRLSGSLPNGILTTYSNDVLSVVQGNIFTFDMASLPSSSQQAASLFNGSEQVDASMVVSSLLVAIWLLLAFSRCPLHRYYVSAFSLLSVWWDERLGSSSNFEPRTNVFLADLGSGLVSSDEWGRVVTEITSMCWGMVGLISGAVVVGVVYLVLKLAPPISSSFAVYTDQYSWTLSAAYLHKVAPLVLIMVTVVIANVVWLFTILNPSHTSISVVDSQRPLVGMGVGAMKSFLAFIVLLAVSVAINGAVMLGINVGYVLAVIHNTPFLGLIQVALGLFKSVWGTLYPRVTIALSGWLKERGLVSQSINDDLLALHTYLMTVLVFNMIVAPCIATALSDTTCYYNVFVQQPSSVISTQVPCGSDYFTEFDGTSFEVGCGSPNASKTVPDDLSGTYYPPFIYSYQCGSALVTDYVPVLMYTFFFSGFVRPLVDMLVLLYSERVGRALPQWALGMLFSPAYHLQHRGMKMARMGDDDGVSKINGLSDELLTFDEAGPPRYCESGSTDEGRRRCDLTPKEGQSIHRNGSHESSDSKPAKGGRVVLNAIRAQVTPSLSLVHEASSKGAEAAAALFDAPSAMTRLLLHVVVMLTFGLAAPYLGVVVACSFFSEVAILRLVLGRYVHLATSDARQIDGEHRRTSYLTSSNTESYATNQGEALVEIVVSVDWSPIAPSRESEEKTISDNTPPPLLPHPSRLLHEPAVMVTGNDGHGRSRRAEVMMELEWTVRGVWRYPSHSAGAVVVVTGLFWGLLSFDMIADVYGDGAGFAAMTIVMGGTPLLTYLGVRAAYFVWR